MKKTVWMAAVFLVLATIIAAVILSHSTHTPAPVAATQIAVQSQPAAATQPLPRQDPFITFHGTLVDESGKPVPSAKFVVYRIQVLWPEMPVDGEGVTGPHGEITYGPVPRDRSFGTSHIILFDLPGHALACQSMGTSHMVISGEVKPWIITLSPSTSISGRVVNEKGDPVEGAFVEAQGSYCTSYTKSTGRAVRTDRDGRFRFDRVPQGTEERFAIAITHPDFADFSSYASSGSSSYNVKPGTNDFDAVLRRGAVVHAQLMLDGKPLPKPGVHVVAMQEGNARSLTTWGISDEHGRIDIHGLSKGTWTLQPRNLDPDLGVAIQTVHGLVLDTGDTKNVSIPCEPGEVVHGVARDPATGEPSQETVCVYPAGDRTWPLTNFIPDADGRFSFRVPVGKYRLRSLGYQDFDTKNFFADLDVTVGVQKNLAMDVGVRRGIRGQLLDEQGNGVPGFVTIQSDAVQTNPEGRFVVWPLYFYNNLSYGFAVDAEHKRGCGFLITSDDAQQDQRFVLEPMAAVTGRIVDENKTAVPNALITVKIVAGQNNQLPGNYAPWKITQENDGSFRISPVPVGLELQIQAEFADSQQMQNVSSLEAGEERAMRPLKLSMDTAHLPPPATGDAEIAGVLLDDAGAPLPGARLQTQAGDRDAPITDETDFKGRFALKRLPRGQQMQVTTSILVDRKYVWYLWKVTAGDDKAELHLDAAHVQK